MVNKSKPICFDKIRMQDAINHDILKMKLMLMEFKYTGLSGTSPLLLIY